MTAREWVDLYRQAEKAPGGKHCLNPDDEPELQTWIDATDPETLLLMLENFAEHGTLEQVDEMFDSIRLLPLRVSYRQARQAGDTHESIVQKLADDYGFSTRTIERKVRTDKT